MTARSKTLITRMTLTSLRQAGHTGGTATQSTPLPPPYVSQPASPTTTRTPHNPSRTDDHSTMLGKR